jgi:hypothetical protein
MGIASCDAKTLKRLTAVARDRTVALIEIYDRSISVGSSRVATERRSQDD